MCTKIIPIAVLQILSSELKAIIDWCAKLPRYKPPSGQSQLLRARVYAYLDWWVLSA